MRSSALLVALTALLVAVQGAKEPATGIAFGDRYSGSKLVGTGVRTKGPIKVYAAGLYVAPMGTKVAMRKYKDSSADSVKSEFYNDLVKSSFGKIIVLKMAMGISKEKLVGALSESVRPRMRSGGDALPKFADLLLTGCERHTPTGKASKGTELAFDMQGSTMSVAVNGKSCGQVKSADLCKALAGCYFDDKSVSTSLKRSCAEGIIAML